LRAAAVSRAVGDGALVVAAATPADDLGLLSAAQTSLLIDQYELAMAASYLERGMNEPAIFELFVRELPPGRD
jgi:nicotinate phosphoribosyltransferase